MGKAYKLPNSWPRKLVNFHLRSIGLRGDRFLNKHALRMHYMMTVFSFILICQEVYGVIVRLRSNNFTLKQIILPLEYAVIIGCNFIGVYVLVHHRHTTSKCVVSAAKKLCCSAEVDEELKWKNYMRIFKLFLMAFAGTSYVAGFCIAVVSPFVRFVLEIGTFSFVLFPVWYPVDVLSSPGWFWAAFLYEAVLFLYTAYMFATFTVVFSYTIMITRIRFDALNLFFARMIRTSNHAGTKLSKSGWKNLVLPASGNNNSFSSRPELSFVQNSKLELQPSLERWKMGMEDLNTLQRQKKLIDRTFRFYFDSCHPVSSVVSVSMAFAAASELRSTDKPIIKAIVGSLVYLFFLTCSMSQIYSISYNTTLLQEAYDNLKISLWRSDWLGENSEFKRLFLQSKTLLNRPLEIKAYSFYPVNLRTFTEILLQCWSFFLFLYQASHNK